MGIRVFVSFEQYELICSVQILLYIILDFF
jgi:hypothetical protein